MLVILGLFIVGIVFTSAEQDGIHFEPDPVTFRSDYTYVMETNTYYKEHKVPRTWSDAVQICKVESAELALPSSSKDVDILLNFTSPGFEYYWLGLNDIRSEGYFITNNGTYVEEISFTNWNTDEPNDNSGEEDCVMMYKNGLWNDNICTSKFRFICTREANNIRYNIICATPDRDYFFEPIANRCYKLHTNPKTWHEAYSVCTHETASLAIINSQAEAQVFVSNMLRYPEHTLREKFNKKVVLLGFSDLTSPGEFLTTDGKTLEEAGYAEWADDEPSNDDEEGHCGSMLRDGRLNDVSCDDRAMFICEKFLRGPPQLIPRFGEDKA